MNEKTATPPSGAPMGSYTPQRERFLGFTLGHFALSLLTVLLLWLGSALHRGKAFAQWVNAAIPLLATAAYLPVGYGISALRRWTPSNTKREKLLSIALPTAVAWGWVAVVLITMTARIEALVSIVFTLSLFLAAPSSLLVVGMLLSCDWLLFADNGLAALGLCGLIAGFLPPLLFALGSFWQAERRKKKKKEEETQNG